MGSVDDAGASEMVRWFRLWGWSSSSGAGKVFGIESRRWAGRGTKGAMVDEDGLFMLWVEVAVVSREPRRRREGWRSKETYLAGTLEKGSDDAFGRGKDVRVCGMRDGVGGVGEKNGDEIMEAVIVVGDDGHHYGEESEDAGKHGRHVFESVLGARWRLAGGRRRMEERGGI